MARTQYGTTWWGKKWLETLTHLDYANRLPRGKTYANTGRVKDFSFNEKSRAISARVKGSRPGHYHEEMKLPGIPPKKLEQLIDRIARSPAILARLANRELDPAILDLCNELGISLFPSGWSEMHMQCSCPDYAVPCKHLAAVIFRVSQEIDANPFLAFTLNGVDLIAELEKKGIELARATKVGLANWKELVLRQRVTPYENPAVPGEETPAPEEDPDEGNWLDELDSLTYTPIEFDRNALLGILKDAPAGFIHGSLKDTLAAVMKEAARLAASQLADRTPRTVATVDDDGSFITIDEHGLIRPNGTLSWKKAVLDKVPDLTCRVTQDTVSTELPSQLFEMFSGFINRRMMADESESLEALFDIWVIATRLVAAGAIFPRMRHAGKKHVCVDWTAATAEPAIGRLVCRIGELAEHIDTAVLDFAASRRPVDPLLLGETLIRCFAQSYVHYANTRLMKPTDPAATERHLLFSGQRIESGKNVASQRIQLQLASWLDALSLGSSGLSPVITIADHLDNTSGGTADETGSGLGISLGFMVPGQREGDTPTLVPLGQIISDEAYRDLRFDALSMTARLSDYCPALYRLISCQTCEEMLAMDELATLMFEAAPVFRQLGIACILPRSLKKILSPTAAVRMDAASGGASKSFMALAELIEFDWTVAIGETEISPDEFASLCEHAGQIVRFKDSFVFVDPQRLAKIRNRKMPENTAENRLALMRSAIAGDYKGMPVTLGSTLKQAISSLMEETPVTLPDTTHATLRGYQERGVSWMLRNIRIGMGSILADDMGLGKTLQVLAVLDSLRVNGVLGEKPALVVAPSSLLLNWQREAQRFTPALKLHTFYGSERKLPGEDTDVILTTYGTLRSSAAAFRGKTFSLKIIDEAQAIKNHATATAKSVRAIASDSCIALSGTPVENHLIEYWSIMEATNPGLLGTSAVFKREIANPIEIDRDKNVAKRFKRMTAPFVMRRMKTDKNVIADLPDKLTTDTYCTLSERQAALYQQVVEDAMARIAGTAGAPSRNAMVLQMILKLKQICNAPASFSNTIPIRVADAGKMERVLEILDELQEANRKVLIFTQFASMGTLLVNWIAEHTGNEPLFIHGSLSPVARQALVDRFQNDRHERVMILSLKAAGTGLNLTAASAVIHYDLWWNPAVENQATDRAYRIGQKQAVTVYRLICANTFEEKINDMIGAKRELADLAVSTGESWIGNLSDRELSQVFSLSHTGESETKRPSRRNPRKKADPENDRV